MAKLYITLMVFGGRGGCLSGLLLPLPGLLLPLPGLSLTLPEKGQPLEEHLSPCWSLQDWQGSSWKEPDGRI